MILRPYQVQLKGEIYDAWRSGYQNVLAVMPTGLGKTKTFCSITIDMALRASDRTPTAILVHRKELVQQISLTLAEEEIVHNIIAPRPVILGIVAAHRRVLGRQFYDYNAPISVVSVDTLNARINRHEKWAKNIRFWITDEAAHLLKDNKWGKAVGYFPNAIGLGVTATPRRLDKRGLGRHADGVFDVMVEGPNTRWGIEKGFLSRYKIAIPPSDYQNFLRRANAGSDFSRESLLEADRKSQIIGDVVANHLRFASGKQTILFTSSVETGRLMEKKFKDVGISAKFLSAESTDKDRLDGVLDFRDKKTRILINVDLFDEGFDVPGIECVQMARATMSVSKYLQMVGRGLRPLTGKDHLILIDHVGNVTQHGLPDAKRRWTLDRIVKKQDKTNLIRICSNVNCNSPFDRALTACPWCGADAVSAASRESGGRIPPIQVDGDLELIDPETLHQMEVNAVLDDPLVVAKRAGFAGGPGAAQKAMKNQVARIESQKELVNAVAKWAGMHRSHGYSDRQIHKRFWLGFGKTISQALAEPKADMLQTIAQLASECSH